ncbi:hypothetical protein CLMAG_56630 [Clostridium magnum DSM 2767]|uniref:Uncharacterized protein n=1 Tax=Clostridium magnum DSM 2767 TaxID=1121326 RepID=A0A161X4V6_9CLOT|nr:hypothetical protein CLMAG_56630 [Clostridium magnum DSM 2767]
MVVSLLTTDLIIRSLTALIQVYGIRSLIGFSNCCQPLAHSVLYLHYSFKTLALKLFRGEPAISEFDWNFSAIHSSSHGFSTPTWFGPPRNFTSASTCPWIGHPVSCLRHATFPELRWVRSTKLSIIALFRLGFPSAPYLKYLTLLHIVTRWLVLQKARRRT